MAVLNYLVFLPESKGGLEYVEGWSNYGLAASILIFFSIFISSLGTHRHIPNLKKPPPRAPFNLNRAASELKETLSNRSFFSCSCLPFSLLSPGCPPLCRFTSRVIFGNLLARKLDT